MGADEAEVRRLAPFVKWRLWRYSEDLEAHVVAEEIEDRVREDQPLPSAVAEEMGRVLRGQQVDGSCPFDVQRAAAALRLDLSPALNERLQQASPPSTAAPVAVVCVVGAPRSGTSTLLDRLVHYTSWAVITDNSHHLWSRWGLDRSAYRFLRRQPPTVLERDTREARLDLRVSWPSEAENILHRYVPCYTHLGGHRYSLSEEAVLANGDGLRRALGAHLEWFGSSILLLKSPFNVTRVPVLSEAVGGRWLIVNARRDAAAVASSIERNGFAYEVDGRQLTPVDAAAWFSCRSEALSDITVDHRDVLADPIRQVRRIVDAVEHL
jgi:hypothetical protein